MPRELEIGRLDMNLFGTMPPGEIIWLIGALALGGVVTGILAGVFGVGGGAVIVPVLAEIFDRLDVAEDVQMHLAVGTSLAIIVPTAIRSYFSHRARGNVDDDALRAWLAPVALGAVAGVVGAAFVTSDALKIVFAVFATCMSANLLFGRDDWRLGDELPSSPVTGLWGFWIGALSAVIGIGGGALGALFLTAYGRPIHKAIGTSAGLGALIALPSAVAYALTGLPHHVDLPPFSIGYVSLIGLALMAPISVLAAPLGVKIAQGMSRRTLRTAFGCFLALVALRFAVDIVG